MHFKNDLELNLLNFDLINTHKNLFLFLTESFDANCGRALWWRQTHSVSLIGPLVLVFNGSRAIFNLA